MALTTGTVTCINMGDSFGFVSVKTSPTTEEAFILWTGATRSQGPIAIWVPELQLALARGLTVTIQHGNASAFIDAVRINAP